MKLAGVVVLFYPSEEVFDNIKSYLDVIDILYIIDNTPEDSYLDFKSNKIKYISKNINIGIAKAYNLALNYAKKDGYDFLLLMDQDSRFDNECLKKYLFCIDANSGKNVILYALNHKKTEMKSDCIYEKNNIVMSSGNVINVEEALKIGGFDERLFIDEVDHEFCFRAIINGYYIVYFPYIYIHHNLGKLFIKNGKKIRLYSSKRLYYIVRNYLFVRKLYKHKFVNFFEKRDKFMIKFIINNLKYSKNKFKTFIFIIKAFFDFITNKMGKRVEI